MIKRDLVLIPGLLCDHQLWRHQCESLADVAEIMIGDTLQDESIHSMAARILEDAPDHFALAGLSMGGYVVQEIMRQAPERVVKLALLDTSARPDTEEQIERRKGLIRLTKMGRFKGVTPKLLPLLIHPDFLEDDDITSTIMEMAAVVGQEVFVQQQTAILDRIDSRPSLADINVETLIICGRQDELTPIHLLQELADNIRKSSLHIIEDCGHLPPLEQPEQVTSLMRQWLMD